MNRGQPFHRQGIADLKYNECAGIYERDLGWKIWTPSYCEEKERKRDYIEFRNQ